MATKAYFQYSCQNIKQDVLFYIIVHYHLISNHYPEFKISPAPGIRVVKRFEVVLVRNLDIAIQHGLLHIYASSNNAVSVRECRPWIT